MKAIVLISGGLDSALATKLIKEQNIEIGALNFKTPFCLCDRKAKGGCRSYARKITNELGIELKIINITDEFLEILKNPKYGYGSNMNPCIDCRILMFRKAREFMKEVGAKFIVTGEVLGQRPMSQHKQALKIIEKETGLEGLILRPLSARLLPETIPEKEGWVKRNKLLNFSGRTRKPQIELAKNFDIKEYSQSSNGCLLTDPEFAKRIKDLMNHQDLDLNSVELLKIGRHFRLSKSAKLIVGRNEKENKQLINLVKENDYLFVPANIKGPTALGRGNFGGDLIKLSCRIICRYCDLNGRITACMIYSKIPKGENKVLEVRACDDNELTALRI